MLVLGYSSFINLEDLGCKISGLLTLLGTRFYFFGFRLEMEDDFSGFYYFFLVEDMSVMCLSLLTNSVGLEGNFLKIEDFSENHTFQRP